MTFLYAHAQGVWPYGIHSNCADLVDIKGFEEEQKMSRFVKRSADNEPLMRLERPTLASSQTTAHIINSCFHEVLSQRQHIDSGAINNMAVSRRGDPHLYHDSFVEEAKQV